MPAANWSQVPGAARVGQSRVPGVGQGGLWGSSHPNSGIIGGLQGWNSAAGGDRDGRWLQEEEEEEGKSAVPSLRSPPPDFGVTTGSCRNFQGLQKTGMFWSSARGSSWTRFPSLGLCGFEPQMLPFPLSKFSPIPAESKPSSCWPGAASPSLEVSQATLEQPGNSGRSPCPWIIFRVLPNSNHPTIP